MVVKMHKLQRDLKFDMDNVICTTWLLFSPHSSSQQRLLSVVIVLECAVKVEDTVVILANKIFLLFLVHGFPIQFISLQPVVHCSSTVFHQPFLRLALLNVVQFYIFPWFLWGLVLFCFCRRICVNGLFDDETIFCILKWSGWMDFWMKGHKTILDVPGGSESKVLLGA